MKSEEIYARYLAGETDIRKLSKEYGVTPVRIERLIEKQDKIVNPLKKAMRMLEKNYALAINNPMIRKPVTYALSMTASEYCIKEERDELRRNKG